MRRLVVAALLVCACVTLTGCGTAVPDVTGKSVTQGHEAITAAGFKVGTVTYDETAIAAAGLVISQTPGAGRAMDAGSAVSLVVAGPAPVVVPSLSGLDKVNAEAVLTGVGLTLGTVTEAHEATAKVGLVTSQTPTAGAAAARGSAVGIVVSTGPEPVAVPSVVGKTKVDATTLLEAASFKVKSQNKDDRAKKGNVIGQSPISGKLAKPGATITITVSTGVSVARLTADLARATRVKYEALHGAKIVSGVAGLYKDSKGVYWGNAWFELASGSDRGCTIWRYTGGSWHIYSTNNESETGVSKWEPGLPSAVQHAIGKL